MNRPGIRILLPFALFVSAPLAGCASTPISRGTTVASSEPARATDASPLAERSVYRFDFELVTTQEQEKPIKTSFTMNLVEDEHGEVVVGRNIPLTTSTSGAGGSGPRQDVGIELAGRFHARRDEVLLELATEMSSFEPPATRKAVMKGVVLATSGKSAVVAILMDDQRRYELTVTPTKLR